jgi:uncharacterized protein
VIGRTTRTLTLLFCLAAGRAFAQVPIDIEADFSPGTHTRFADRVNKSQTALYAEVLAAYDARLAKYPDDVTSHIERCRFIELFAYSEDVIIESASDDLESCRETLWKGPHASNVDVILYGVESNWEEEKSKDAEALLPKSRFWSQEQQATLLELLTDRFQWRDEERAAHYAMQAVRMKPGSRVLLTAVNRWIQLGAKDKARRALLDAPASTWDKVPRVSAAQLLAELGEPKAAATLLREGGESPAKLVLAQVLAKSGEVPAARELYREALTAEYVANDSRVDYFRFEIEHGSRDEAVAAYQQLRDQGFGADPLGRERLSLFLAHPGAAWQWRDLLGPLMLAGLLLALALVPALVIVPIHYRGLARRVAGKPPDKPMPAWTLKHAWYALGAFTVANAIAMYAFDASPLEAMIAWTQEIGPATAATDIALGHVLIWTSPLALVLLLPLLRGRSVKTLLLGRWSLVQSVFVGVGLAIALKFVGGVIGCGIQALNVLGSDTVRALQGAHQTFGLVLMLLSVALLVPVIEELVFRGVLLEASRGQVSFWFSAILQAGAFVLLHESWSDMPILLVFALTAAWLVRRSEGLLAPIAMHATTNLTSALMLVDITSKMNA